MKLSQPKYRVMRHLGRGRLTEPTGAGRVVVAGQAVCKLETLEALKRAGFVEQIEGGPQAGRWRATPAGVALARELHL